MTTISEIARAADVSVESVLRVLNRDNVSRDIANRVIAAMEAYGYGRLPRPEGVNTHAPGTEEKPSPRAVAGEVVGQGHEGEEVDPADAVGRAREQLLHAVEDVVTELEDAGSLAQRSEPAGIRALADRMAVMDALLHRLAQDIDGMKRELGRARNERLEDLTLLVDLITTSWRMVDRRLGRIDHKVERMEGLSEYPRRPVLPSAERPQARPER
jgi:hypothetical protein